MVPRALTIRAAALVLALLIAPPGWASELTEAVKGGDRQAVAALLAAKADVNEPETDGTTALHWAVRAGDDAMVSLLLGAGANASAANRLGVTPLSLAAASSTASTIEALIAAGADPRAVSSEGESLLMIAARAGNVAATRVLLAHGVDPNLAESWQGQTALMFAAAANHADVAALLLEAGAVPETAAKVFPGQPRLPRGQGVAIQAAHSNFPKGGLSALHFAARQGAMDAARVIAEHGADLNVTDPDGITPLYLSIINAHFDLAAMLIDKGADVNKADRVGRTPLFMAADANSMEWLFSRPVPQPSGELDALDIAKRLIEKGANVNAQLTGRPFILHHNATGNRNLVEGSTPFMKAATTSDLAMMRLLLEHGADPNLATRNGTTPLMALAGLNWVEISSLGTEEESIEGMRLVLERGADVNAVNQLGETAVHGAAQRGANTIVEFLFEQGARLDVKNKDGRTPLDEARGQADTSAEDNVRRPEHKHTQALLAKLLGTAPPTP